MKTKYIGKNILLSIVGVILFVCRLVYTAGRLFPLILRYRSSAKTSVMPEM